MLKIRRKVLFCLTKRKEEHARWWLINQGRCESERVTYILDGAVARDGRPSPFQTVSKSDLKQHRQYAPETRHASGKILPDERPR